MEDIKEPCEDNKKDVPNCSSSSSKDLSMTLPEEAFNNFLQGKRHMLVQDYSFAVQSLATACEMYVKHYGELAIECGEVYFLYGKALFRLSQQQAGVLGGAINEGSNEDENSSESEGKENESDKNENENESSDGEEGEGDGEVEGEGEDNDNEETEADGEKEEKEPSESTDSPPAVLDEGSSETKVKGETSKSADGAGPSQQEPSVESGSSGQISEENKVEDGSDENQEPEEDDLELAWNTLETAKSIFKRQITVEAELKVAEILQLLAEISMESDNNPAAINDLKESLKIQQKHLKPDDRILAETYYQMGLAQMLEKVYPEALENFRTTKQILELRRENLKNTKVDDADGTFKSADIQAEIADLDTILVDIQEKIEDTMELITNKEKEIKESLKETLISEAGSSSFSLMKEVGEKSTISSKPVSNITHLLKRKKPDEISSEDGSKRIKTANVPNGETKVSETESKVAEM